MKVDAGRGKLYDAQKTLRARWDTIADLWSDDVRRSFEEHIWTPLDQLVSEELRAIDRVARIMTECRRECSGQR